MYVGRVAPAQSEIELAAKEQVEQGSRLGGQDVPSDWSRRRPAPRPFPRVTNDLNRHNVVK